MKFFTFLILLPAILCALPSGYHVTEGTAHVSEKENEIQITYDGRTTIQWNHFNLKPHEKIQLIPLGQNAALQLQVLSSEPVQLSGTIEAQKEFRLYSLTEISLTKHFTLLAADSIVLLTENNLNISGALEVKNEKTPGEICLLGQQIALHEAFLSVLYPQGKGRILMGKIDGIDKTSQKVFIDAKSRLLASATEQGDGGLIFTWAQDSCIVEGFLAACGGPKGGDGGTLEVSSPHHFECKAHIDVSAPMGRSGTLILDPEADIIIQASGVSTGSFVDNTTQYDYTPSSPSNTILIGPGPGTLLDYLSQADVVIKTSYSGTAGPHGGRITVADPILYDSPYKLSLIAQGENLVISSRVENIGQGSIQLEAPQGSLRISPSSHQKASVMTGGELVIQNIGQDVILQGGTSEGESVVIGSEGSILPTTNLTLNNIGGNLSIIAGTAADTSARIALGGGTLMMNVTGNINLSSGPITPSEASIVSTHASSMQIQCGGNLTLAKGAHAAADYMMIGTQQPCSLGIQVGGSLVMIGDIAGILLASGDTLDVTVGQHFEMVSSPTGPVTVYGQHHAYFYVTGSTKMIDPTFLGDDFRLNP